MYNVFILYSIVIDTGYVIVIGSIDSITHSTNSDFIRWITVFSIMPIYLLPTYLTTNRESYFKVELKITKLTIIQAIQKLNEKRCDPTCYCVYL